MKDFQTYIQEKLVIDANSGKRTIENNHFIIYSLCSLKPADPDGKLYLDAIEKWVKENNVLRFDAYADYFLLPEYLKKYFKEDKDKLRKYETELIVDGKGKEILGKKWKDPKIYVTNVVLIFHEYDEANKINMDRVFVKK